MGLRHRITPLRDAILLLLWGGVIMRLWSKGELSNYLHPALQPFTLGAGVLLLILAAFAFRGFAAKNTASHECCHGSHEHHHHGSLAGFVTKTVVLLLPLVALISGQALQFTITTIQNRGVVQDLKSLPAANASEHPQNQNATVPEASATEGAMPIQVIDLLYAVQMPTYRQEFEGKQVEMIGQYVPLATGNPKGDRFQLVRLFITCCAADAKPVGVTVQFPRPLKLQEMAWVKVTGTPVFPVEGGRRTPVLEATKVDQCAAPEEPFVY